MHDKAVLVFLVQVLVLLLSAKCLGELFKRWGYPALVGEILTGLFLGPTLLGRAGPTLSRWQQALFSLADDRLPSMLESMAWLGVLFMLLTAGFEVSISTIWRQGKSCIKIGVAGVIVPILLGLAVFWWLPDSAYGTRGTPLVRTLLLATTAAISAIPVIAKVLHDMEILKSDFGLTTLSAFIVNDVLGWVIFGALLALAVSAGPAAEPGALLHSLFEIVLFSAVCLVLGSRIVGWAIHKLEATSLPHPATTLTFIFCLGLLCGAITHWIGVHAILGFFLAGIMIGNTPDISDRTRSIISQMVHAVFVPIFFATIGLRIDFVSGFNWALVMVFTAVALGGKFVGAGLGALWSGTSKAEALSTGIAHIPGGAMEIIIGVLASDGHLVLASVRAREELMGTAMEKGLAIPHGRIAGLKESIIAFGRSREGIEWDARDGKPTRFVFLALTPEEEPGLQVQILGAVARTMMHPHFQERLVVAEHEQETFQMLSEELRKEELNAVTSGAGWGGGWLRGAPHK